jgi:phosphoenolpyruvate carboxykinase (GTP)
MGRRVSRPPKIYHVNWFRRGADGKFLWPGYGENVRVLKWMLDRIEGRADAEETPIGSVPALGSLTLDGLKIPPETIRELLRVEPSDWLEEYEAIGQFLDKFGSRLPEPVREEHRKFGERLQHVATAPK